jgi:hypothetical protein
VTADLPCRQQQQLNTILYGNSPAAHSLQGSPDSDEAIDIENGDTLGEESYN